MKSVQAENQQQKVPSQVRQHLASLTIIDVFFDLSMPKQVLLLLKATEPPADSRTLPPCFSKSPHHFV